MTAANTFHSSESVEHFTPAWLIEKMRWTLGSIDFDPASSDEANLVVRATTYCTKETNGFFRDWSPYGPNIWTNPPGGLVDEQLRPVLRKTKTRPSCTESGACGLPPGHTHQGVESSAAVWWRRLTTEFEHRGGQIHAGFLGFSLELLASAQSYPGLQPLHFPCCIPRSRIKFDTVKNGVRKQGTSPTHSNVIALMSRDPVRIERFRQAMADVGFVALPGTGGKCATCRHWSLYPLSENEVGLCAKASSHAGIGDDPTSLAVASDSEGYAARLKTRPNHGCVQWEGKT